ncbi:YDG domain-containing protein [Soonwooa sp.]|uniref:YDG domain-containing protein n=1 Tax=Soonwooa sp. TaxID=1938592 RepID=UPI0028ACB0AD|nr:YDG domain-containing protein [Soonwooa sp.]
MKTKLFSFKLLLLIVLSVFSSKAWGQKTYKLVTATSDLVAGSKYLVASRNTAGDGQALGSQNSGNYRNQSKITVDTSLQIKVTPASASDGVEPFEIFIQAGSSVNTYYLYDGVNNTYLIPSSGNNTNNQLKGQVLASDWTIVFNAGAAIITNTGNPNTNGNRNLMSYNSGATRFSCYASTQAPIYLYKEISSGKTVTFNANTGTGTMAAQSSGVPANLTLNQFQKTGYSFQNWHTDMSGTGGTSYADGQQYDFSADMTLYAQWQINQYNVSYNANASTSGTVPLAQSANYNTSINLATNTGTLARTGYKFNGWNTNAGGTGTHYNEGASFTMPANDVTLYAEWVSTAPSLSTTGSIASMTTTYGTASTASNFTVNGVNLTGGNVKITPPAGFELSTTSGGTYTPTLTLPVTAGSISSPVYVRLASTANAGTYNGGLINLTDDTTSTNSSIANSTVAAKGLTVSGIAASNKVYDRGITATITGTGNLVGVVPNDDVNLSGTATGTFNNKTVGTSKPVAISGFTLTGAKAGNYTLTQPTSTADITAKPLTTTGATAQNKAYDNTTTATISGATLVGVISSDVVTVGGGGTFASANVGTGIAVTPNLSLGGADAGNYTLTQPSGLTANITAIAPTITPASISLNVNATANITSNSTGATSYTSANPAIASVNASGVVTGLAIGTTTINVSQVANGNYTAGTETVTVTVTEVATGTYRTTSAGSWPGGTSAATWERMTATGWTTATPAAGATDLLIIRHAVTSGGNIAASGGTKMQIDDQGTMSITHPSTFASMVVKKGGTLDVGGTGVGFNASGATLDVEDGGKVIISAALTNASVFWRAKENFAKGSTVEVTNHSSPFFANPSQIDTNADGYFFGNLTFSGSSLALSVIGVNDATVFNLTEGDLTVNGTSNNILLVTSQNKNVTINGSVNVNAGQLRGFSNVSGSVSTLTINKDVNINAGIFNFAAGSGSVVNYLRLKGNLTTAASTTLQSSDPDSDIYFIGNGVQHVDVAGATNTARFRVKTGASVELKNNLVLNKSSELSVEDGATLNFGYKTSDSSPSIISNGGEGTNKFALEDGGTIKITHPKGVVKSIANDGNVQLAVSNKTFSSNATYHYVGKVNQEMGDALNSSSTKNVYVELASNAVTISPSSSFGITNTGTLDIRVGKLIENDVNYITGGSSSTNGGTLKMAAGTQYYITKASATTADSEYIPRFYNTNLLGGEIVLASTGNQTLRGGQTYKNLTFINGAEKTVSTATTAIDNILIKDNTVVNPGSSVFGGTSTTLTMQNTSLLKLSGGGTKPDMTGAYTLAPTTKIEFTGSAAKTIRLSPTYANVTISGDNVSINSTTGGVTLQAGTNFHVTNTGVFKVKNINGFSGAANTAVKNTNSPSITLDAGSTVDYTGVDQSITHQIPYANLSVSSAGVKTATGTTTVNQITTVSAGELKLPETANNVTSNILEAQKGIHNTGGTVTFENNAILMQDAEATNTGDITLKRKATVPSAQYNIWSSPVASQDLYALYGAAGAVPAGTVMEYITKTDLFKPMPAGSLSVKAKAYSAKGLANNPSNAVTAVFKGVPNNADIQIPLSVEGNRFNAVGNPYPSNLDLNVLYQNNVSNNPSGIKNITNLIRFWDNTNNEILTQQGAGYYANQYAIYNLDAGLGVPAGSAATGGDLTKIPDGIVKPGQGFIVRANTSGDRVLNFNNGQRIAAANADTPYYKGTSGNTDRFWLSLETPGGIANTIAIAYNDLATNNNDIYDTSILDANNSDLFYSLSDNQYKQAIQSRKGGFADTDAVKLGAKYYKAGTHKIKVVKKAGAFDNGQNIYLHDKVLNTYTDISNGAYAFDTQAITDETRFEIVYKSGAVLGANDTHAKNAVVVYKTSDAFVVLSKTGSITKVELYDMNGRLLQVNDKAATEQRLSHETLSNGMYLLKITRGQNVEVKKVLK